MVSARYGQGCKPHHGRTIDMETNTGRASNDAAVREDVLLELKWDPKIKSTDIAVAVQAGVVTLSGYVASLWELDAAEKAAKRVYGVKGVANNLEVKMFWERTDPEIARSAVQALESHVSLPKDIKVSVKNGRVTLEGTVEYEFQRALAYSSVKKLRGVSSVVNKIDVKPVASPSDLENKIGEALRRSAEVDARRIRVEVRIAFSRVQSAVFAAPIDSSPSSFLDLLM
jgi:osmotically-inducible protein OsmY